MTVEATHVLFGKFNFNFPKVTFQEKWAVHSQKSQNIKENKVFWVKTSINRPTLLLELLDKKWTFVNI